MHEGGLEAAFVASSPRARKKRLSPTRPDADTSREMRKLIRRAKAERAEGGFTLVEMVVTVAVLAVIFLAVAGVLESGLRALAAAKARARGNEIATQGIEDLQRFSFNNLGFCSDPATPEPAGLEDEVELACNGTYHEEFPCDPSATAGTVPRPTYTCRQNNIEYSVKRYIAWVDGLRTTKRLAVYVEWDDLAGRHQVSQQSSLRAPDQSAITGLAPPTFTTTPAVIPPSPTPFSLTAEGRISSGSVQIEAQTSNLSGPATTTLNASTIPAHEQDQVIDVSVSSAVGFPTYNGFPVIISGESYTVVAGAGTTSWRLKAASTGGPATSPDVAFTGDRVYVTLQTLSANGNPQSSTIPLVTPSSSTETGKVWRATLDSTSTLRFGQGTQHVPVGILRAADGKSTGAFATTTLQFCEAGLCDASTVPAFTAVPSPASTIQLGTSGQLLQDIVLEAATTNLTAVDIVTVTFLTQSGTVSVALERKANTTCLGPAEATTGNPCEWTGRIPMTSGFRFSSQPANQTFYFAAQQVVDSVNPDSIDKGSTAVFAKAVTFG